MVPTLSLPIDLMPEALEFLERQGLQDVFERALMYVSQTVTEADSIRVRLDYDYNADCPCVYLGIIVQGAETVQERLRDTRPVNMQEAVRTVYAVLTKHIAKGQADKTARVLPAEIRALWPAAATGGGEPGAASARQKEPAAT